MDVMVNPIRRELRDGLGIVTLQRPDRLNALHTPMARQLGEAVRDLAAEPGARALLIRADGPYFTAGGDVGFFRDALADGPEAAQTAFAELIDAVHAVILTLTALPVPVVAAVQGGAAGIGISLLAACDFVVAERTAIFNTAYINLGASPDGGSTWLLPRLLGLRAARRLLMLGKNLDAETALDIGLIDRTVEPDEVDRAAESFARELAAGPTAAYGRIKRLLADSPDRPLSGQLDAEKAAFLSGLATADFREGLAAFTQRRKPVFPGR